MLTEQERNVWSEVCAQRPRTLAALTGAGVSAESGIATFRGKGGWWDRYDVTKMVTPEGFEADPKLVWEWYDQRRQEVAATEPNAGHQALAEMGALVERCTVVTQNIDGLHQRAGSSQVLELHGSLWQVRCLGCGLESEQREVPLQPLPPRCTVCGAMLRPAIVWFGEMLPKAVLEQSVEEVTEADVLLVVGTSALIQPAASLPMWALEAGVFVVEVNPEPTPISQEVDLSLRGPAGAILPVLTQLMRDTTH